MPSLIGLQTAHPDLVLNISHPVLFPLISAVEGPLVTVGWEMQHVLFSLLWLFMLPWVMGGIILLVLIMGCHILPHRNVFPLIPPLCVSGLLCNIILG